jgi:hypothetical protein
MQSNTSFLCILEDKRLKSSDPGEAPLIVTTETQKVTPNYIGTFQTSTFMTPAKLPLSNGT